MRRLYLCLERNIVFHIVELPGRLLRRRRLRRGGLGFTPLSHITPRARLTAALAAPEHLHHIAPDLGAIPILAVLVLPLSGPQAPFDIDLRTLLQVFTG